MNNRIIIAVIISASLMLNVYLLLSFSQTPKQPAPSTAGKCRIPLQAVTAPPEAQLEDCKKRLGGETSLMTIGMVVAGLAARKTEAEEPAPPPDGGVMEDAGEGDDSGPVVAESQLCSIARRTLANEWKSKGADIMAAIKKSVSDPQEQEKNLIGEVKRFSETLKLGDEDRQKLEQKFRENRQTREKAINDLLATDKIDYQALINQARGLFTDADDAVGGLFGNDAKTKLADSEREGRLTVLAIIASIADTPWDEAAKGF
jgi:hypothetical protein